MDTLQSWILIVWMFSGIGLITIQAYRLQKWKENVTNSLPK